jgi:hypothetical protein
MDTMQMEMEQLLMDESKPTWPTEEGVLDYFESVVKWIASVKAYPDNIL